MRSRTFRLLPVVTGALMLMAAFAPSTKADVIAYFNFEDSTLFGPPDFTSEFDQGLGVATTGGLEGRPDPRAPASLSLGR